MNRLPKEKRTQLMLVIIVTLAIAAGLWSTLIHAQQETLRDLKQKRLASETKRDQIRNTIKNNQQIEKDLATALRKLDMQEEEMASGDLYASMYNSIRRFKPGYKVEIPEIKSTGVATPVDLLPEFPYKQVGVTISGTAYYFDLGRFVADFENRFPNSRIINLDLTPASPSAEDREKLLFRMDIVSLVKSGGMHPLGKL
jgi:Tfp pilus assembly protein PilO